FCSPLAEQRYVGGAPDVVETRERLGVAVGVELLHARKKAVDSKDAESEKLVLEGAATGTCRSRRGPARQDRVVPQSEHVVGACSDGVGRLEQGAQAAQHLLYSARRWKPDHSVVPELDIGRERRGIAIEVKRSHHRRDRARRRRGALARGAVGEDLGV